MEIELYLPVDVRKISFFSQHHSVVLRFLHIVSMHHDIGSVGLALLYLHDGRDIWHHHRRGYFELVGVVAQALGVVAERRGDDTALFRFLR